MTTILRKFTGLWLVLTIALAAGAAESPATPGRSEQELDQLLGPVALYPDALMALMLPAATVPADLDQAAAYLRENGDPAQTDGQPDDSIKALVHYPELVKWMSENSTWTDQLGQAFLDQPADVMNAVQRLRARAKAAGTLVDTPEQQVITEDGNISIEPAEPDTIYVPSYDPGVVYMASPGYYGDAYLTFGVGYPVGYWLGYDLDWWHHRIWTIDPAQRNRYWQQRRDWRHPVFPGRPGYTHDPNRRPWRPSPDAPRPVFQPGNSRPVIARPAPFPVAAPRANDPRRNLPDRGPANRPAIVTPRPAPPVTGPRRPDEDRPERDARPAEGVRPGRDDRGRPDEAARPARPAAPRHLETRATVSQRHVQQPPPPPRENRENRDNRDDRRDPKSDEEKPR